MSTLALETVTVSTSNSRTRDCSSGYRTSQTGSSRCSALVTSDKSTALVEADPDSRLRMELPRDFISALSRLSSDFTNGLSGSCKPRSDRAACSAWWRRPRSSSRRDTVVASEPLCELAQTSRNVWAITSGCRSKERSWSTTIFSSSPAGRDGSEHFL